LSSLCGGSQDYEEGIELLGLACDWLCEACNTRQSFEVIGAYLNRFLYIYATTFAELACTSGSDRSKAQGILMKVDALSQVHSSTSAHLKNKMQYSLSLVRHFSRLT